MKKILTLFLIVAMVVGLSACSTNNDCDCKSNENSTVEQEINLDDCYVCYVYFNNTNHSANIPTFGTGQGILGLNVFGYYIRDDIILEYELAELIYLGSYGEQCKQFEIDEKNRLNAEFHGITSYSLTAKNVQYLLNEAGSYRSKYIWTWGELKQLILEYNLINGEKQ